MCGHWAKLKARLVHSIHFITRIDLIRRNQEFAVTELKMGHSVTVNEKVC